MPTQGLMKKNPCLVLRLYEQEFVNSVVHFCCCAGREDEVKLGREDMMFTHPGNVSRTD
jgi:hypothetical protein